MPLTCPRCRTALAPARGGGAGGDGPIVCPNCHASLALGLVLQVVLATRSHHRPAEVPDGETIPLAGALGTLVATRAGLVVTDAPPGGGRSRTGCRDASGSTPRRWRRWRTTWPCFTPR
jgi:hypothetical protein